jgi:hypothetical protein
MEIKNIAFEKLNDLEFKNTIQVHDLVWQSGVPNYLGCRISVPGADPGFQVRGGALKKNCTERREARKFVGYFV